MIDDLDNLDLSSARRKRQTYQSSSGIYGMYQTFTEPEPVNNAVCRKQPYHRSCAHPLPLETDEEIASAMVNNEIPMPDKIAKLWKKMRRNKEKLYVEPPESEPTFFKDIGDVGNDCRTVDTVVYDLIVAKLREEKKKGKRFEKDL